MKLKIEQGKAIDLIVLRIKELDSSVFVGWEWLDDAINTVSEIFSSGDPRVSKLETLKYYWDASNKNKFSVNHDEIGKDKARTLLKAYLNDIYEFGESPERGNSTDSIWKQKYDALNKEYENYKSVSGGLADKAEEMMVSFDKKIAQVDALNVAVKDKEIKVVALEAEVDRLTKGTLQWDNLTFGELFSKLSIGKWAVIGGALVGSFLFGAWVNDATSKNEVKKLEEERDKYQKESVGYKKQLDSLSLVVSKMNMPALPVKAKGAIPK